MRHYRPAGERGHADHGWLDSRHSFSFAEYYDPRYMGFSALRVINEDWIAGGAGFPTHPHREMEILTYVLEGAVAHRDSMGNVTEVPAGEFQIMSAGTGITHSEFNPRDDQTLHLYQIWIQPNVKGLTPRYAQCAFPSQVGPQLILSPDEDPVALRIYQDMRLWRWQLSPAQGTQQWSLDPARHLWLQVVRGQLTLDGQTLQAGDGLAIWEEASLSLLATEPDSEVLLFDLP